MDSSPVFSDFDEKPAFESSITIKVEQDTNVISQGNAYFSHVEGYHIRGNQLDEVDVAPLPVFLVKNKMIQSDHETICNAKK